MQQQLVEGSMRSRDENMTRKETHMGQRPLSSINWSGVKLIYCAARYIDKSIYQLTRMKNKTSLIFALMQRYDKYSDHISVSRLTVARFMRPIWLSCKTIQHHAILCNTIQYHAIPCNTISVSLGQLCGAGLMRPIWLRRPDHGLSFLVHNSPDFHLRNHLRCKVCRHDLSFMFICVSGREGEDLLHSSYLS